MDWVANRREFLRLTFRTLAHRHSDAGYQGPIYNNNSVNRKKNQIFIFPNDVTLLFLTPFYSIACLIYRRSGVIFQTRESLLTYAYVLSPFFLKSIGTKRKINRINLYLPGETALKASDSTAYTVQWSNMKLFGQKDQFSLLLLYVPFMLSFSIDSGS